MLPVNRQILTTGMHTNGSMLSPMPEGWMFWFVAILHVGMWCGVLTIPSIIYFGSDEFDKFKNSEKTIYMLFMLSFGFSLVVLLLDTLWNYWSSAYRHSSARTVVLSCIFAFALLGLAFGAAFVPYAHKNDAFASFVTSLTLAALVLGMLVTFHCELAIRRSSRGGAVIVTATQYSALPLLKSERLSGPDLVLPLPKREGLSGRDSINYDELTA